MFDIVEISKMNLVGLNAVTSNHIEASKEGRIVKLHQELMQKDIVAKDERLIAAYSQYEDAENGSYQYFIGHVGEESEGLESLIIPAGKYLCVPSDRGMLSDILPAVWQKIWRMSADGALGANRSFDVDFEFHNYIDPKGLDAQVDVYLSII
jgi:predicted transcriptional regulator YdeE